jgi:phage/plasmid-like protein (TIGR03299 family)
MAYVGEVPWHRLGTYLGEENVTAEQMLSAAGLDWEVVAKPVYYFATEPSTVPDGALEPVPDHGALKPVPDHYTLVRLDTGRSLGSVVGSKYAPFQNAELFTAMEALREGGLRYHTAGSLMGGRRVWALAQMPGAVTVRRNGSDDVSAPFILGYSTHDGSACVTLRLTTVRVVCWNTLSMALREHTTEVKLKHTQSIRDRLAFAAEILNLAGSALERETATLQRLADTPMGQADFAVFAAQVLTGQDDADKALETIQSAEGRSRTIYDRKGTALTDLFNRGNGNQGRDRYDALNAVTQYVDTLAGKAKAWQTFDHDTLDAAWHAAVFGSGEAVKQRAYALLTAA